MSTPEVVVVDGLRDEARNITFWGKAVRKEGEWICYANVDGALCIVAVDITFLEESKIRFSRVVET